MKKIVLVCGLIAGVIVSAMMIITLMWCYRSGNFDGNIVLAYATMLIAFSLIFVGTKNYRDKLNGGVISFGKAFKIGLYITLVASTIYVGVWLIAYYLFIPDFMDRYTDHMIKQSQSSGISGAALAKKVDEMNMYKAWYKNPLLIILLTYTEILPAGLLVSLVSTLLLKKKENSRLQQA